MYLVYLINNLSIVHFILSIKELITDNVQSFHNTHNLDNCHHRVKRFKLTRTQTVIEQINWLSKLGGAEPVLNTISNKHDCRQCCCKTNHKVCLCIIKIPFRCSVLVWFKFWCILFKQNHIIIINRHHKDTNSYYDKNIKTLFKYESNIRNVVCVLRV